MKPDLGLIVHYREASQVFPAMIVHVHSTPDPDGNVDMDREGRVNIAFWDGLGNQHTRDLVPAEGHVTDEAACWFQVPNDVRLK